MGFSKKKVLYADSLGTGRYDTSRGLRKITPQAKRIATKFDLPKTDSFLLAIQEYLDVGLNPCIGCREWKFGVRKGRCKDCALPRKRVIEPCNRCGEPVLLLWSTFQNRTVRCVTETVPEADSSFDLRKGHKFHNCKKKDEAPNP